MRFLDRYSPESVGSRLLVSCASTKARLVAGRSPTRRLEVSPPFGDGAAHDVGIDSAHTRCGRINALTRCERPFVRNVHGPEAVAAAAILRAQLVEDVEIEHVGAASCLRRSAKPDTGALLVSDGVHIAGLPLLQRLSQGRSPLCGSAMQWI